MAFRKLDGCDNSDMRVWANCPAAANFMAEIVAQRDAAMRKLVECKACEHDCHAQRVKALNCVIGLMEEAGKM